MFPSVELIIAASAALREEDPRAVRDAGVQGAGTGEVVIRQPRLTGRLRRRVGALLIVSGLRLLGDGQPRGLPPLQQV